MRRGIVSRKPLLVCLFLALSLSAGCGPLADPAVQQGRASVPAEQLAGGQEIAQTFRPSRARLAAVEVVAAVYPQAGGDDAGDLRLRLDDAVTGRAVATTALPLATLVHNERYRLDFPPEPESAGRTYRLVVTTTSRAPARATLWSARDDAYVGGERTLDGRPVTGDLAFRAFYDYDLPWLVSDLASTVATRGWLLLALLTLLLLPGAVLQVWLLPAVSLDAAEAVGMWLGLGLAATPLLLYVASLLHLQLGPPSLVAYLCSCLLLLGLRLRHRSGRRRALTIGGLLSPAAGAFLVAGLALAVRFIDARDLALPMWVDSVHHTLIAQLIAESGRLPTDYGSLMPTLPFTYHFGFHSLVAYLNWLTGLDVAQGVLVVGQVLDALIVFPVYLLASQVCRDRRAGLAAAVAAGLVALMPAYYVTWGRYPQLAGLEVLPAAALIIGWYLRSATAIRQGGWRLALLALLAVAGQVQTHPRVALMLACWVLADWLLLALAGKSGKDGPRLVLSVLLLALAAGALLAPWLGRLAQDQVASALGTSSGSPATFPLGLVVDLNDRYLLLAAVGGLGLGLVRRRREAVLVALWVGLCLAVANPGWPGPVHNTALSNESLAIAAFLPVALLDALLVAELGRGLRVAAWPAWARGGAGLTLLAAGVLGAQALTGIVNPSCLLATVADLDAVRWVEQNTEPTAAFLVNSRPWQAGIHSGSDAGYWLLPLAHRRTSQPPLVYAQGMPSDVAKVNEFAQQVETEPSAAQARELMLAEGLEYVFIGQLGGPLRRETFANSPDFRLAYGNGSAWVYRLAH